MKNSCPLGWLGTFILEESERKTSRSVVRVGSKGRETHTQRKRLVRKKKKFFLH